MKKIILVLFALISLAMLSSCDALKSDSNHATVSLTTSSGQSFLGESFNGANRTSSGQQIALRNKLELVLQQGETAKIEFKCDACGSEQVYEVREAFSEILHCDCPVEMDENGNSREYFGVCISFSNENKE